MSLGNSLGRLGATSLLLARQRLELAALDVEEELAHTGNFLVGALATALLATLSLGALAATVVVVFWDTARIAALVGVTLAFSIATAAAAWRCRRALRDKPPFLGATLGELAKDGDRMRGTASHEPA